MSLLLEYFNLRPTIAAYMLFFHYTLCFSMSFLTEFFCPYSQDLQARPGAPSLEALFEGIDLLEAGLPSRLTIWGIPTRNPGPTIHLHQMQRRAQLPCIPPTHAITNPASPVHQPSFPLHNPPSGTAPSKPRLSDRENKFSTADRTVLEELKRTISTLDAQFVVKGGITNRGVRVCRFNWWRRHHPFNTDQVPYPRCYEKDVLDL